MLKRAWPGGPGCLFQGVVVSSGRMMKAVKVQTTSQEFHPFLKKHFKIYPSYLVSDPTDSLQTGDIVKFAPLTVSKCIRHVVTEITHPYGKPLDERPPLIPLEELKRRKAEKKEKKTRRKAANALAYGTGTGAAEVDEVAAGKVVAEA